MSEDQAAIFVFESPDPGHVTVYPDLSSARESLESLDVAGDGYEPAFTITGRVVLVQPSDGLFANLELTEQVDLERLLSLLQVVAGPAALAGDPSAYAREWMRLEDLDAERPPFVPQSVWSWYQGKRRLGSSASS